jgi:hypothetical protein
MTRKKPPEKDPMSPPPCQEPLTPTPDPATAPEAFAAWQNQSRAQLVEMLGIPLERIPLEPESRGHIRHGDLIIEKWIFTSEPGSRVTAVLHRPAQPTEERMPAVVLTFGHGGSKSQPDYSYPAQLFARLGIACLALDPIGEEERHREGRMGTRAHDPEPVHRRALASGRLIMGKLLWDTMRGLDLLLERDDIDPARVGVCGNSLGGAKAGWMAALETRLSFAVVSGWAFAPIVETWGKFCTRIPNERMRQWLTWDQYLSLAAPQCAVRIVNGDADVIIDKEGDGEAWQKQEPAVQRAAQVYAALGRPDGIQTWYEKGGGHRPYAARVPNLAWLVEQVKPAGRTSAQILALPELNFGDWCQHHGFTLEQLYGTPLHLLGASVADMGIMPLRREQLAVLAPHEVGRPEYTIEGWLDQIERNATARTER